MSSVEAGILAGVFVGCVLATVVFAALLLGMFPALSCPSCKRQEASNNRDPYGDDSTCCLACEWLCMRYCGGCRPKRLRKMLLEDMEELERAEREREETEQKEKEQKK